MLRGIGGKFLVVMIAVAAIIAAAFGVASASNVHFKAGSSPNFTDNGLTLSASGTLAGLGSGGAEFTFQAVGFISTSCSNPSGGTVPGQDSVSVTLAGTQAIPASEIKNGSVSFNITTEPPVLPTPGSPNCPSFRWSELIRTDSFRSGSLSVLQAGQTVLTLQCGFVQPTSDGPVPTENVRC